MNHLHKNPSDSGLSSEMQSMSQVAENPISNVTTALMEATTNMIETVRSASLSDEVSCIPKRLRLYGLIWFSLF